MKTQCSEQKPKFEKVGQYVHIYMDEEVSTVIDMEDNEIPLYKYHYAKVPIMTSRDDIISSIIKIKYPSFDAEIAAMANGSVDAAEHQEWRNQAKLTASEFEEFKKTLF